VLRTAKFRLAIVAVAGGALALYVLERIGPKAILSAATAVGWRGFTILCLYQLGQFLMLGAAWYVLSPASSPTRARVFIWARMVRDATSELLPFSHLGGIVLGARAAISKGLPQPLALASIVTDITSEMLAQIAFTAAGIIILIISAPHNSPASPVTHTAVFGLITIALSCAAVFALQRYGRTLTRKLTSRLFPSLAAITDSIVNCIQEIYGRPGKVGLSVLFHCGGWLASALSTWIALFLMGVQANIWVALAIESLVCAVRSMAFWVPNGLGVQEVAYAAIAPLFGIGPEVGLAISILKRARDVAVDVPILLCWQWSEGRRFLGYGPTAVPRAGESSTPQ
jgi:glycosyltransferase 2 family protein